MLEELMTRRDRTKQPVRTQGAAGGYISAQVDSVSQEYTQKIPKIDNTKETGILDC